MRFLYHFIFHILTYFPSFPKKTFSILHYCFEILLFRKMTVREYAENERINLVIARPFQKAFKGRVHQFSSRVMEIRFDQRISTSFGTYGISTRFRAYGSYITSLNGEKGCGNGDHILIKIVSTLFRVIVLFFVSFPVRNCST